MTLITFEDGRPLKKEDGTIGTEQACCCCGGCIQIDYQWFISNAQTGTGDYTFSGSVKIRSVDGTPFGGEIQCFSDPDVLSVSLGIFSGRKMVLNYGDLIQSPFQESNALIEFVCDGFNPRGTMFSTAGGGGVDAIDFPSGICCGETIGTFSNPSEGDTLSATISRVGAGECNCEGFTLVEPS